MNNKHLNWPYDLNWAGKSYCNNRYVSLCVTTFAFVYVSQVVVSFVCGCRLRLCYSPSKQVLLQRLFKVSLQKDLCSISTQCTSPHIMFCTCGLSGFWNLPSSENTVASSTTMWFGLEVISPPQTPTSTVTQNVGNPMAVLWQQWLPSDMT